MDWLQSEAIKQVGEILVRTTSDVDRLVRASVDYADVVAGTDSKGAPEIIVDAGALIRALAFEGSLQHPDYPTSVSQASDVALGIVSQWLKDTRLIAIAQPYASLEKQLAGARGVNLKLSVTVRQRVLPAAKKAAAEYGDNATVELFHLVEALIGLGTEKWQPLFSGRIDPNELARLGRIVGSAGREQALPQSGGETTQARAALREDTPVLDDAPSEEDLLGRAPLADMLAARLQTIYPRLKARNEALVVHLHGPWGSGKSSLLLFLTTSLQQADPPWLVVDFNAWRSARVRPPWWNMVQTLRLAVANHGLPHRQFLVDAIWLWWRVKADWLVAMSALALLGLAFYLGLGAAVAQALGGEKADLLGVASGLVTLVGGMLLLNRSLFFGSSDASRTFDALRADAYKPVMDLFCRLVAAADAPVIIYLDDLDRCEPSYVTELLEGVQTLFRNAPVVFVAVGDRDWICESFERKYADFAGRVGEPGRPIGYLFLDKIFQMSIAVPEMTADVRNDFLAALLGRKRGQASITAKAAEQALTGKTGQEDVEATIAAAPDAERPQLRAAAVKQLAQPAAVQESEHRLEAYSDLIEANPRAMKQLVNAYGINLSRSILEGRRPGFDALARWTILEQRWPAAAAQLAARPQLADPAISGGGRPEPLATLWEDPKFQNIIGTAAGYLCLTPEKLASLPGVVSVSKNQR